MKWATLFNFLVWGGLVYSQVWMTEHGAPQQVWLYCDMLQWCANDPAALRP